MKLLFHNNNFIESLTSCLITYMINKEEEKINSCIILLFDNEKNCADKIIKTVTSFVNKDILDIELDDNSENTKIIQYLDIVTKFNKL